MDKKIKVMFFIPSLLAGGTERVMSYIAQHLNKKKFDVTLVVLGFEKDNAFTIQNTRTIYLNKPRVLSAIFGIYSLIRKERPEVAVSALSHLNAIMGILSIFFPKTKFVGREVNIPSILKDYPEEANRSYPKILYTFGHRFLDIVICQSQDMYQELKLNSSIQDSKLVIINNPITQDFLTKEKSNLPFDKPKFITVGSLEPRKGHLRLLEILADIELDFQYTVIGNGSLEKKIFQKAKNLGIDQFITHIPFTHEVQRFLAEHDVFLQGSYVEGFPNALLESCAVGTPVIAFAAPGGINEIVEEGVNGYIAKSPTEFVNCLKNALNRHWEPADVSESVLKKYNQSIILNKYENLIINCISYGSN